ncbi:Uncharacterized protein APZ42_012218 [Daphnia magna]|uniref:Uncharacterized protein n=1 Tax=Daphnia magna TaxID=35525 RepID=A0A162S7E8_9CRUS|nr:Uncharacterized protein APZ42_012218 [Daphnia magna]
MLDCGYTSVLRIVAINKQKKGGRKGYAFSIQSVLDGLLDGDELHRQNSERRARQRLSASMYSTSDYTPNIKR